MANCGCRPNRPGSETRGTFQLPPGFNGGKLATPGTQPVWPHGPALGRRVAAELHRDALESRGPAQQFGGQMPADPSDPTISYVAKLSEEDGATVAAVGTIQEAETLLSDESICIGA